LWAKALAEGEGNIEKGKKGCISKLRVSMIKDEWGLRRKKFLKEASKAEQLQAKGKTAGGKWTND
jgi:hypothetical protein